MQFFKNFWTKFIEGILFLSSTITSLTVVLIIVFLFKEGLAIYGEKPVEQGFVIAVNSGNNIKKVTAAQIKDIFDVKITNWKEIGGTNDSIIVFRLDNIGDYCSEEELGPNFEFLPQKIDSIIQNNVGIIAFFSEKNITKNFKGRVLPIDNISLTNMFAGKEWFPTAQPAAQMGFLPLILGTLWVSLGAILLALPLGLAVAIYMAEVASPKIRNTIKPIIELLSGIPSVVYGFFGLIIVVPLVQQVFKIPVGETALAGSIILAIMALPTIITVSEDAIRTTPRSMKEASLALGASHFQTIYKVIIPYSISGITAAAILGIGRAIGETMAVLMVTGNAAVIPHTFLEPVRTIPATIAAELGEAPQGGLHYKSLFALGCILFIITFFINLMVEYISKRNAKHN
ncbi:MAG: phosphate ABC transporter permease subunit PstC [Bacteroidota bacterium]